MGNKRKFIYKKPFDTNESIGLKSMPQRHNVHTHIFNDRHAHGQEIYFDKEVAFLKIFFDANLRNFPSRIIANYKDLVEVFGKPLKSRIKDIKSGAVFLGNLEDCWATDVSWFIVLKDEKCKGRNIYTPVIIRNNGGNGKNHSKLYPWMHNKFSNNGANPTSWRVETLEENFGNAYCSNKSQIQDLSEIESFQIYVGRDYSYDQSQGVRSIEENRKYISNLIKEFK
tara:strand:+ start:785 stop:1462 length:678 start_codon:yes stop_codon:yes gene_type:complete